jgi:tetratricopeptide (TPR) repeat protein
MKLSGWWIAGTALSLAGCAATNDERVHDYNEDGVYLYQRGDYVAARQSFDAALAVKPNDAGLLYNLGQCYDRMGDAAKAERYYNECLQRVPNHAACRHALADLLVRTKRQPEAARMVQEWLVREPRLATPYAEDGWLAHQAGDLPRAQGRLQQALALDPRDVRALTELGLVYEAMHRPDRALVLYERALEQEPSQPEITKRVNFLLTQGVKAPRPD